jgi:hypothetical protein
MVEIELCRSRMTKRGALVVDDDAIRIILPMVLAESWVIAVTDATWVDPLGAALGGRTRARPPLGELTPPWRRRLPRSFLASRSYSPR